MFGGRKRANALAGRKKRLVHYKNGGKPIWFRLTYSKMKQTTTTTTITTQTDGWIPSSKTQQIRKKKKEKPFTFSTAQRSPGSAWSEEMRQRQQQQQQQQYPFSIGWLAGYSSASHRIRVTSLLSLQATLRVGNEEKRELDRARAIRSHLVSYGL